LLHPCVARAIALKFVKQVYPNILPLPSETDEGKRIQVGLPKKAYFLSFEMYIHLIIFVSSKKDL
jgi:hypothetical protein